MSGLVLNARGTKMPLRRRRQVPREMCAILLLVLLANEGIAGGPGRATGGVAPSRLVETRVYRLTMAGWLMMITTTTMTMMMLLALGGGAARRSNLVIIVVAVVVEGRRAGGPS